MSGNRAPVIEDLLDSPELTGLLPILYAAWADGALTRREVGTLGEHAGWLPEPARALLVAWLDPDAPPTAADLLRLQHHVQAQAALVDRAEGLTLAQLGAALHRRANEGDTAQVDASLTAICEQLGYVGTEATRDVLEPRPAQPLAPPAAVPDRTFDVEAMQTVLEGPYARQRARVREILAGPEFRHHYDVPKDEQRAQVLAWLRILAGAGLGELAFPGVTTDKDAGAFFATFETLACFDLSLLTKFGVQFGLFGGSILHLGNDRQRQQYLPAVATLELPGCFAMSELGHGSNVRDVETVARYDASAQEFVIDTPSVTARKEWIGNAALHGRMATVFAQLEVGTDRHGVHAFLVPLRDDEGQPLPGVEIEDCGLKMGLNGVDNGRLSFHGVRVPRANLLDRFGQVAPDGTYTSPVPSSGRRFFTMLRTLVGGRVAVGSSGVAVSRSALTIAVRYASARRQFGPSGGPEMPVLDYRVQQLRLMPLLARSYALTLATQALVERIVHPSAETEIETEALAAGFKVLATDHATSTVQACRLACGGQGYLAVNRFAALKADSEIFVTYEGDNTVLLQLVAKGRLASFQAQFADSKLLGMARHLASQAAIAVTELNPVTVRLRSEEHLRDRDFLLGAFRYREARLVASLASRLKHRIDQGMESFDALNECQDHALATARAYVHRWVLEEFLAAIDRCSRADLRAQLALLCELFALAEIHDDAGWFLQAGYVEPAKARAIRDLVGRLCAEVRDSAVALVEAFDIPEHCLAAPIGLGEMSG